MKYEDYLRTDYWKAVSDAVKKRADYRCQVCNSPHDLCAHHRTYEHRGRELDHLSDLICLCRRCHEIFHGIQRQPRTGHDSSSSRWLEYWLHPDQDEARENHLKASDTRIIDNDLLKSLQTDSGGYTSATLNALCVDPSSNKGWKRMLIGSKITAEDLEKAMAGRDIRGTKRKTKK